MPRTRAEQFDQIYDAVRAIPVGRVMSYGQIGDQIGASARTVGWALRDAPDDVPWQRVVGADGYLRIARRAPHLRDLQKALLEDEGVVFDDGTRVPGRFFLSD